MSNEIITVDESRFSPDKLNIDESSINYESGYFEGYGDQKKIDDYNALQNELRKAVTNINGINENGQEIDREELYKITQRLNELFDGLVNDLINTDNEVVGKIEALGFSNTKEVVLNIIKKQAGTGNAYDDGVDALLGGGKEKTRQEQIDKIMKTL